MEQPLQRARRCKTRSHRRGRRSHRQKLGMLRGNDGIAIHHPSESGQRLRTCATRLSEHTKETDRWWSLLRMLDVDF